MSCRSTPATLARHRLNSDGTDAPVMKYKINYIQSDLDNTRLCTTRTSVIRGFFSESWYPQLIPPISVCLGTCLSVDRCCAAVLSCIDGVE